MRPSRLGLVAAALGTAAFACNALLGLDELAPYEGSEAGVSSSSGSGSSDTGTDLPDGAAPDGGGSSSSGGNEGDAGVAPCDPNELPEPTGAVFVKSGSDGDGRMNNPFGSVATALDRLAVLYGADGGAPNQADGGDAGTLVPTIYVYAGSFSETRTLEVDGLPSFKIDGAWVGSLTQWTRDCSPYRRGNTVINGIASRGLVIRNVAGPSRISNLSLFTGVSGNDNSRIGVQIVDSGPLTISNATIVAENAVEGPAASKGTTAQRECNDISTASCKVAPAVGAVGDEGAVAHDGTFDVSGYVPGDGVEGYDGKNGDHSRGQQPQTDMCVVSCSVEAGDPLTCQPPTEQSVTAGEAGCGCGGPHGKGGGGGKGGGASVAVLANTQVTAEYSILQAKNGGHGLPGADGGEGGLGSPGQIGESAPCSKLAAGCCPQDDGGDPRCVPAGMSEDPVCRVAPTMLQGGLPTTGAGGGGGGRGGNGAGGPSYTVVLLPGGSATYVDINRSFGVGGNGADPAPDGKSAFELKLP